MSFRRYMVHLKTYWLEALTYQVDAWKLFLRGLIPFVAPSKYGFESLHLGDIFENFCPKDIHPDAVEFGDEECLNARASECRDCWEASMKKIIPREEVNYEREGNDNAIS